jgi:plasmid stabilization system protein ParE
MALLLFPPMRPMTTAEVLREYGAALDAGTHYLLLDGQTLGDRAAVLAAALDEPRLVGCVERGKQLFDLNDPFRYCMVATVPEAARAWAAALEDGAALFTFAYRGRLTPARLHGNTWAVPRKRIKLAAAYGRPEASAAAATSAAAAAHRQTRIICARPRRAPVADWIELLNFSTGDADRFLRACYAVVDCLPQMPDTARSSLLIRCGELVRRADGRVDLVTDRAGLRAYRCLGPAEVQSYFEIAASAGLWLVVRRADGSGFSAAAAEYRGRDDWARVRAREAAPVTVAAALSAVRIAPGGLAV